MKIKVETFNDELEKTLSINYTVIYVESIYYESEQYYCSEIEKRV